MNVDPDDGSVPWCVPGDVEWSLRWQESDDGLRGRLVARNVGDRVCRLLGKPTVIPLGRDDGEPLPVEFVMTLEYRSPPYVDLEPGRLAAAPVFWSGWCGAPASGSALVRWRHGSAVVNVEGPCQPECRDGEQTMTSSWFELLPDGEG